MVNRRAFLASTGVLFLAHRPKCSSGRSTVWEGMMQEDFLCWSVRIPALMLGIVLGTLCEAQ